MIRWYQRWRPCCLVQSNTKSYRDSYNNHPHHSHRRDTFGFQSLDSEGKAVVLVPDNETSGGGAQTYAGGHGEGELDHDIGDLATLGERIKVRTEVRQEVRRMKSPGPLSGKRGWHVDTVSTEISART